MKIFIIGFMGSGKSTIGKRLAQSMNIDFVDLDNLIEEKSKNTISSIFNLVGESGFRKMEKDALFQVCKFSNMIISTGGGTPCFDNNMDFINNHGYSVYLQLNHNALYDRLINSKRKRPLLQNKSPNELKDYISSLLEFRHRYYQKANLIVDCDNKSVNEIVTHIRLYINSQKEN